MQNPPPPFSFSQLLRPLRTRWRAVLTRSKLRRAARSGATLRLVVGSGGIAEPGWIETDIHSLDLLRPAHWDSVLLPGSIAAILAEHVWEHLTLEEGTAAAAICHRYLRSGGYLRLAVPDGHHPDPAYRERVRIGGSGAGAHDHKMLYTREALQELLEGAGFIVTPLEYFDSTGAFHAEKWDPRDGLVRRTRRFDPRNRDGQLHYTSLMVDAHKR